MPMAWWSARFDSAGSHQAGRVRPDPVAILGSTDPHSSVRATQPGGCPLSPPSGASRPTIAAYDRPSVGDQSAR